MAKMIEAIRAYSPRVKIGSTADLFEVASFISGRSGLNEGAILNVMAELREAITFFNMAGRPVRLRGLGTFSPTIELEGRFGINHRPDKHLISEINIPDRFNGDIVNRDMLGKTVQELVKRWNTEHPKDKVKK